MEDKLARNQGHAEGSHPSSTSLALFHNPSLAPALVFALVPALAPAPISFNKLFKQFMIAYLEFNQRFIQSLIESKQHFKVNIPKVYNDKLHINYYFFCQQYKDYSKTAGSTGANRTSFVVFFFCVSINIC